MCGRFSLTLVEKQLLLDRFDLEDVPELQPRYNIAPSQVIPIIRNDSSTVLSEASWGLIPRWAKDDKFAPINARAESVTEKATFKDSFERRRCLIPADSFYEWKSAAGQKVHYRIMMKDSSLFAFAGIFDMWHDKVTCSIITTEPNEVMKDIHVRMPVILEKDYLTCSTEDAVKMLQPYDSSLMKAYQIAKSINSPQNDNPDVIKPAGTLSSFVS